MTGDEAIKWLAEVGVALPPGITHADNFISILARKILELEREIWTLKFPLE